MYKRIYVIKVNAFDEKLLWEHSFAFITASAIFDLSLDNALQFSERNAAENHLIMLIQNNIIDFEEIDSYQIEEHFIKN